MSKILSSSHQNKTDSFFLNLFRQSLIHHPDRIPAGPGSEVKRKAATVQFQGKFSTKTSPHKKL